jgi:hypothetical protein
MVLLAAGACAPQDSGDVGGVATSTAAAAAVEAPPAVQFTARDFSFEGPDTIPAGLTTLVLDNEGPTYHHVQLVRLAEGHTAADLQAAFAAMRPGDPYPAWATDAGGVNTPDPGAQARATLMIEAGEYAVICFVDTPDHVPHIAKGMMKGLTVTPASAPSAAEPVADLTLTLVDYAFSFSAPPTAGQHVIRIENAGPQPHEVLFVRLDEGKTVEDFMAWGQTFEGPAPGRALGGAPAMALGQTQYVPLELTPGNYLAVCFVPDSGDRMPHIAHGMVLPFTVS